MIYRIYFDDVNYCEKITGYITITLVYLDCKSIEDRITFYEL